MRRVVFRPVFRAADGPEMLLLTRPVTSHVALGTGRNGCVGAMLIRMAASVATGVLAAKFAEATFDGVGGWRTGSGFCFPASVYVTLRCS
jgi:cytochrome P450